MLEPGTRADLYLEGLDQFSGWFYTSLLTSVALTGSAVLQIDWRSFTITEKAPTRAFSWLKVPTSAFTFKTLC